MKYTLNQFRSFLFKHIYCVSIDLHGNVIPLEKCIDENLLDKEIILECNKNDFNSEFIQNKIKLLPSNITIKRDTEYNINNEIPLIGEVYTPIIYFDDENNKVNDYDICEYWLEEKLINESNLFNYTGTVGYPTDPKSIDFIYDSKDKIINVNSRRLLITNPQIENFDNWKYTNNTLKDNDSSPYFRFPRSKDGVTIPRFFNTVFNSIPNIQILVNHE